MTKEDFRICKAFLESGKDLELLQGLKVKHPSIEDILTLGGGIFCEDLYWNYVFCLLCDPYDNMVWLDEQGVDYETVTAFDVFTKRWIYLMAEHNSGGKDAFQPLDNLKAALLFFLGEHEFELGCHEDGEYILYDKKNPGLQINSEIFHYITTFIQTINGITNAGKIIPANQTAKKILIEDKRAAQKKKRKNNSNNQYIGNMMAGAAYGGNGGITPFNICQIKIYQLVSSFTVNQKKMHYNHIMTGVYSGTVNFDYIKKEELDWVT